MTEVTEKEMELYVNVECKRCNQKFVKQKHSLGYICPHCNSIVCSELDIFEGTAEEGEALVKSQYNEIRSRGEIPIYPLVLYPKNLHREMADMIEDYVSRYKTFWETAQARCKRHDVPLRELVNAFCMVREINENVGFAALNICHARKFFPPID